MKLVYDQIRREYSVSEEVWSFLVSDQVWYKTNDKLIYPIYRQIGEQVKNKIYVADLSF